MNGLVYLSSKLPSKYLIRNLLPCEVCNDSVKTEKNQPNREGEGRRVGWLDGWMVKLLNG